MKISLRSENSLVIEDDGGAMTVESPTAELQYSPFHMLGSSLAYCTLSVLQSWATHAKLNADRLRLAVSWGFAESPHRVSTMRVEIEWPDLPEARRSAAARAAALCAVHATLSHPPQIEVVTGG